MKPCKTKYPIFPVGSYTINYECGYVEVILNGVSTIYTTLVKSDATSITLGNTSGEGVYDIVNSGLDIAQVTDSVFCTGAPDATESFSYSLVCTDQGNKLLKVNNTTGVTSVLNLDGSASTAVVQDCSTLESDAAVICVLGTPALMWVVKENGVPNGDVYFTDAFGIVIPTPPFFTLGQCEVDTCTPTISDAFGDDLSTLLPGTSFVITKPDCCRVQIVTSAGTFTLREKETYYGTTDFNCPITITSVAIISGSCSTQNVHIISNNKGI